MKTVKIMSIIGCVVIGLSVLCILAFSESDTEAAMGWGVIASIYGIALSIVGIVSQIKLESSSQIKNEIHLY